MTTLIENRDARTLHPQAQEELRRRAIKMLKQGRTQQAVADDLDVTRQAVGKMWKKYKEDGWSSVKKQKRGRREGDNRFFNPEQESEIQKLISDKTTGPTQAQVRFVEPGCSSATYQGARRNRICTAKYEHPPEALGFYPARASEEGI